MIRTVAMDDFEAAIEALESDGYVVIEDAIAIRPIMLMPLSFDHRLVDGQQSVSFLVRLKELVEDPARLMLEV